MYLYCKDKVVKKSFALSTENEKLVWNNKRIFMNFTINKKRCKSTVSKLFKQQKMFNYINKKQRFRLFISRNSITKTAARHIKTSGYQPYQDSDLCEYL